MKSLININARSIPDAIQAAQQAIADGNQVAFSGGGTDLLQQLKDGTDLANVIINLRNVEDTRTIVSSGADISVGGLITLT